ncbi:MAG: NAD-dependent epimerase/dehydratase family protein [Terracidiphilus sp.]
MIVDEDVQRIVSASLPWKNFTGLDILISGASGFLPSYMLKTLIYLNQHVLSAPANITALVRRPVDIPGVEVIVQDVCKPLNRRFHYVIHGASQASPRYYKTDPVGTLLANTRGTENMLNAAIGSNSFLYLSSGDVYSRLDTLDVRSCYGESKRMGEVMCTAWLNQVSVPVKIARISHTYGPGMKLDDGRVFADFVRDILNGGPIVLHSDGSARRPFLYLADATEAFFTILLKGEEGQAYNVANPSQIVSIRQLADRLASLYQLDVSYIERTDSNYLAAKGEEIFPDIGSLEALGWSPVTSIEAGFRRTVESYR